MDAVTAVPDETTSLLTHQTDAVDDSDDRSPPAVRQRFLQKQILLLTLVLILLQWHLVFFNIGSVDLKLQQICYHFYKDHHPDRIGPGGKIDWLYCYLEDPVVQKLRGLLNWDKGISSIVLLLIAVPYGKLADLRGKKKVIILALAGQLLSCLWTIGVVSFPDSLPVRLTWAAASFWLIGGGIPLSITLVYLLASESLHEEQRSQLYFSLFGVQLVTGAIAPYVAVIATITSLYLQVSLALVFLCGCFIVLKFVHESKILEDSERSEDTESNASHHASEAPALSEQAARPTDLLTLLKSRKVLLTLIVFIVPSFAENAFQALSSYFLARRGPDQTFQQVLLSIFPGQIFRAVLFALFVPWAFSFLQRRFGIRQAEIDSWIIRGSLLLLALSGAFVTSSSSFAARVIAVIAFATGFGLRTSLLSYITSLAGPKLRGRLYGAVQVAEVLGQLIAWPILQDFVARLRNKEDPWLDLPFIFMSAASVCVLAMIVIPRARLT